MTEDLFPDLRVTRLILPAFTRMAADLTTRRPLTMARVSRRVSMLECNRTRQGVMDLDTPEI